MANKKISQLTTASSVEAGDFFPLAGNVWWGLHYGENRCYGRGRIHVKSHQRHTSLRTKQKFLY